jgi:hypothetical protein
LLDNTKIVSFAVTISINIKSQFLCQNTYNEQELNKKRRRLFKMV